MLGSGAAAWVVQANCRNWYYISKRTNLPTGICNCILEIDFCSLLGSFILQMFPCVWRCWCWHSCVNTSTLHSRSSLLLRENAALLVTPGPLVKRLVTTRSKPILWYFKEDQVMALSCSFQFDAFFSNRAPVCCWGCFTNTLHWWCASSFVSVHVCPGIWWRARENGTSWTQWPTGE